MTNVVKALPAFEALGFKSVYDAKPHQVQHDLLPAFGISAPPRGAAAAAGRTDGAPACRS